MTTTPETPARGRQTRRLRIGVGAALGVAAAGALAGCAGQGTDEAVADQTTSSSSAAVSSGSSSAAASDSASASSTSGYADGSYEAEGTYTSPGGQQSITVSVTLSGGVVTAVTVTPEAKDAQSSEYQKRFASGISAVVVGKNLDDLEVSRVSGSSLTSEGFAKAIDAIKSEAAA